MSNQIQHIKISRAAFDTLTEKSEFAIYFVTEVDDSISLYTGSNAVSEDIRMVDTLPDTENAIIGKVYYNEADGISYIYNGEAFVYLMGDVVFHYDVMPEVGEEDNGRTAIYTGDTDETLGYVQGNAYKVIGGKWTGITQESSNLQLAAPSYEGTTTITLDSVAGVGASDVAARADHTHALDASIVNAIGSVSVISSIVDEHSTTLLVHSQAIASNASAIAINSKAIADVNSRVEDADAAIELVNSTLEEHAGSITVMSQKIGSNTQAITDNATAISVNSTAIAANATAISVNSTAIANHDAAITSISSALCWTVYPAV